MKQLTFIGLMLITLPAFAQKMDAGKVPAAVKESFTRNFPGTTAKWELEKKNYEANFKKDSHNMSATFDPAGKWMETETNVTMAALPSAAKEYINKNYSGKKIKETAEIKKADGTVNYEAEINGMDVIFDQQGKFIKAAKD
ncbi:MAG: PepSY-like domain-containing protein [Taibaiella sp.]|nr:PepSY-like domain-containing protein [Taibaiella sp.]